MHVSSLLPRNGDYRTDICASRLGRGKHGIVTSPKRRQTEHDERVDERFMNGNGHEHPRLR